MTRRIVLGFALLVVLGCENGPSDDAPPLLREEGDPCRPSYKLCVDDEIVRECIDGYWEDRTCEESCADIGPAMMSDGCAEWSLEVPETGCICVPEPGACAPGDTRCDSETELGYCDGEQVWTAYDCDDLCAASLATPISTGCDVDDEGSAACWCVAQGTVP